MKAYIPNALSLFRMFAWIPVIALVLMGMPLAALILFVLAALSDGLDGYLARRWQVTSTFGQKVDQEADKVLVLVLFVFASIYSASLVTAFATLVFVLRDWDVSRLRRVLREKGLPPLPSSFIAKSKTAVQMAALSFYFASFIWPATGGVFYGLMMLAVLMVLYTWVDYTRKARQLLAA